MVGDPVFGKNFINRKKELALLKRYLEDFKNESRKNIAVIGLRKIGKTSLFLEFQRSLDGENLLCNLILLPQSEKISSFINEAVKIILRNLVRKTFGNIDVTGLDVKSMSSLLESKYPRISYRSVSLVDNADKSFRDSFESLFDFFEVVRTETSFHLMIILDEFQNIAEYEPEISELMDIFRKKVMFNTKIWYMISGSAIRTMLRIVSNINQPNFEHFTRIELGGFDYEHTKQLIYQTLGDSYEIGDSTIAFIYDLTDGLPFYVGIICESLKTILIEKEHKRVDNDSLAEVLVKELYNSSGRLYNYFSSTISQALESKGQGRFIEILKAISVGSNRPKDICKKAGFPLSSFTSFIKRLIELSLVEKSKSIEGQKYAHYDIKDPLLKYWLKEIYGLKVGSSTEDIKKDVSNFKKSIKDIMESMNTEIGKGAESRVRELFRKFDGDFIFKGETLPKFDKISNLETENGEIDIAAYFLNYVFLAEVSKQHINVKDLDNFENKIESLKNKGLDIAKKIMVVLKTIDDDAVLEAQKRKIDIWRLEDVNDLLRKHSLPRINI